MATKMLFLFALFGLAFSKLPHKRQCEGETKQDSPTRCSNYENIEYLDKTLKDNQKELQERIAAVEGKTRENLETLSSVQEELKRIKLQTKMEINHTKTQLQENNDDISSLKKEIQELRKSREREGVNINEIEERLNVTERKLRENKAKLENLETETKGSFSDTQKLLNLYKNRLSHLNTTTQELEGKVEARLDATKTDLDTELKKIQDNSKAFSAKLKQQKATVSKFMEETGSKFRHVDEQLKIQNTTVNQQKADTDTLKSKTAVNAKVAFSATIIESRDVFTGPKTASTSSILIFNRVFTNIGNAYNSKTGCFTAPLKGVYHFSFMTFGYNSYTSGAILVKNGRYQVSTWEFTGPDASDTTSNTVILELNANDTVNIILWEGGKIHTSVFSGFLVFPTS
ncbi:uncharacterized protein At4g38062-like [Thunnus albacares]|uniref:uncharacterized protein At4g38062-like n=1 Tax=Thunnus albacares TaxID=8236 RepID=UPI001CF63769|nr:uncharacterized protein At4g38062-like [Thunnus albacares]